MEEAIQEAQAELQEVMARAERLKEFIAASKKLFARRGASASGPDISGFGPLIPRRRKTNALALEVTAILSDAKRPLHVSEIVAELQRREYRLNAKNPIGTVAVALSRRPDEFEKVGPNTFALVTAAEESEPEDSALVR